MSVVTAIFNRGNAKLLAALAIPLAIAWGFYVSSKNADREVAEVKQQLKDNPIADRIVTDNYSLKEVDDQDHVKWQLSAKRGVVAPSGQEVELTDVVVEYYDDNNQLKMHITAPVGNAVEATKYIKLSGAGAKKVVALGEGGKAQLSAPTVELKEKNQFLASGGVSIEWPQMARVTGDSATGAVNVTDLKNFKIFGHTHAVISMH